MTEGQTLDETDVTVEAREGEDGLLFLRRGGEGCAGRGEGGGGHGAQRGGGRGGDGGCGHVISRGLVVLVDGFWCAETRGGGGERGEGWACARTEREGGVEEAMDGLLRGGGETEGGSGGAGFIGGEG